MNGAGEATTACEKSSLSINIDTVEKMQEKVNNATSFIRTFTDRLIGGESEKQSKTETDNPLPQGQFDILSEAIIVLDNNVNTLKGQLNRLVHSGRL